MVFGYVLGDVSKSRCRCYSLVLSNRNIQLLLRNQHSPHIHNICYCNRFALLVLADHQEKEITPRGRKHSLQMGNALREFANRRAC